MIVSLKMMLTIGITLGVLKCVFGLVIGKARRENSAASRLLGSTSLRFALHGWQRLRFLLIGLVILVVINIGIYHKERLLAEAPPPAVETGSHGPPLIDAG